MARKSTPATHPAPSAAPLHFSAGRPLIALVAAVATAAAIAERWAFGHAWGDVRRPSLDGPRDPSGQLIQDETLAVREVRRASGNARR